MGVGKFLKKVGRGVLAAGTLGGSELAIHNSAGNKAKRAATKATGIANDVTHQNDQLAASEKSMQDLLAQQPTRISNMGSAETMALKNDAYGSGPLAEYQAMREQSRLANEQGGVQRAQGLSDELQNQSTAQGGAQANAYAQLAQGGGLSGGARERIASGLGQQNMLAAQTARLGAQRAGEAANNAYAQGQLDITGREAESRRGMQNAYLGMQGADTAAANQFAQDQYGRKLDVGTGLAKARQDVISNAYNQGKR